MNKSCHLIKPPLRECATGHSLLKTLARALGGHSPISMADAQRPLGEKVGIRGAQHGAKKTSWRKRCWGEDLEKAAGRRRGYMGGQRGAREVLYALEV